MSGTPRVLVLTPFRRPTFRTAISPRYPREEPWDSPALVTAGALEDAGFEVELLPLQNIFVSFDEARDPALLEDLLEARSADVYIFSSDPFIASRSTSGLYGIRVVSRLIRARRPESAIGVVGRLATSMRSRLLEKAPELDFTVLGETDLVLPGVVADLLAHGAEGAEEKHPYLLTRRSLGTDRGRDAPAARVEDLNEPALPAFHLLGPGVELYFDRRGRDPGESVLPFSLRTSLGCRFQCKFCAGVPNWRSYRTKSPARVGREIDALDEAVGSVARVSFLEDEIFTLDDDHVKGVTEVLGERDVRLDGVYTHASVLDADAAGLLAPVTDRVFLGLDNPDDSVLKEMGKGQQLDTVLDAVETARRQGLKVHLEWIVGAPTETVDTLITSLSSIYNLLMTGAVDDVNTYVFCPHPGTHYQQNADAYGLEIVDDLGDAQESGGYPVARPQSLTRPQVFTAYLMSQLVISECLRHRERTGPVGTVTSPNRPALRRLFARLANG